jgi:hypothetical protein
MSTKKKDLLMSSKRLVGLLEAGSFGFPSDHWIIKDLKDAIKDEEDSRRLKKDENQPNVVGGVSEDIPF